MQSFLSPRDIARAVGVSESSVKRWVDLGRLRAHRTAGGHRRIPLGEVVRFVREAGIPLARPELLGLTRRAPMGRDRRDRTNPRGEHLLRLLQEGEAADAQGLVLSWYLEGASLAELADGPLRSSLEALGELWHHGEEGIVIEHRATDICLQAVNQLRLLLLPLGEEAPLAIGGSPDVYLLGSLLASAVVAEGGWRSVNLGAQTPPAILARAVRELRPRLVWLSLTDEDAARGLKGIERLLESVEQADGLLIVGGRSHREAGLPSHPRLRQGASMADLAGFARDLRQSLAASG
ncbi:MAG TPA: helix-turn-helix domain-containing protein [Thermoanaerobaculia bacterium]|nr:helix-turn-helix domain-containing protein [Thermoanaerobaculia bacterium]